MKLTPKTIANITMLVYWGPANSLYYLWGFFLLIFLFLFKKDWLKIIGITSKQLIVYTLLFLFVLFTSFVANFLIHDASLNNFFWAFLTYGSSFSVLVTFLIVPLNKNDLKNILGFSICITLIQVFLGYFQMLQATSFQYLNPFGGGVDSGDNFVGTTFNLGIGNLVAVKISLMLLLFWPFWFAKRNIYNTLILVFLFIGWILTSALYSLILGLLVIVFFYFVNKLIHGFATFRFSASIIGVAIVSFLCIVIFVFTQPDNVGYLKASLKATYSTILDLPGEEQTIGKVLYYRRTLKDLPWEYPSMLLFGVGPGNYSSRSAWLVSGEYLLRQPSYIPITPSEVANDYTLSLWSKNLKSETFKGAGSILQQPFSSWLSVFAEFGLPGLCIFLLTFYTFYRRFEQIISNSKDVFYTHMAMGLKISLAYILLLFFIDNLFEWPLVMGQFFIFASALVRVIDKEFINAQI